MNVRRQNWRLLLTALCLISPAAAQLRVGDEWKFSSGGSVAVGYGSSLSADGSKSFSIGGNGSVTGSYFNPNFFRFTINPFLNRQQVDGTYNSLSTNNGLAAAATLFGGSHIPITFNFNRTANNTEIVGLPNGGGLLARGDGQQWGVEWNMQFPSLPRTTISYTRFNSNSNLEGTSTSSVSSGQTLAASSSYSLGGFSLQGNGTFMTNAMNIPEYLATGNATETTSKNSSFGGGIGHSLPWRGSMSAFATQMHTTIDLGGGGTATTTHVYVANANIQPLSRLGLTFGAQYTDNLAGLINESALRQGARPYFDSSGSFSSDSLSTSGTAVIHLLPRLSIGLAANRIVQHWSDQTHTADQLSGTLTYNYSHSFLGSFRFNGGVVDSATKNGNSGAGLVGEIDFSRKVGVWDLGSRFGYSQSVETMVALYQTSMYSYGANMRRRIGTAWWSTSFSGTHSGMQRTETSNHSESVSSTFSFRRSSFSGSWGQSKGFAVYSIHGLVDASTSVPTQSLSTASVIEYDSHHYSFGGSFVPRRNMGVDISYWASSNSMIAGSKLTFGATSLLQARLKYPFRKMYFNAGYTRATQTVSVPGATPFVTSSFYFGLSRWFNFF